MTPGPIHVSVLLFPYSARVGWVPRATEPRVWFVSERTGYAHTDDLALPNLDGAGVEHLLVALGWMP